MMNNLDHSEAKLFHPPFPGMPAWYKHSKGVADWPRFYVKVRWFPWRRTKLLLTNKQSGSELNELLFRYEGFRAESRLHIPDGPELLSRLDTVRALLEGPDVA
jgi:hypothetical protein